MESGFPIDILLFAMVAAYLVFRLRGVLGRRDGHESDYQDPFNKKESPDSSRDDAWAAPDKDADGEDDRTVVQLPGQGTDDAVSGPVFEPEVRDAAKDSALRDGVLAIQRFDHDFNVDSFLNGACAAFEMTLNAYVDGDTATLKSLLSADVYGNFSQAIRDREQAGEVLEDTLVGIDKATVAEATVEGSVAFVTVKFVTQQINVTRDENGDVVDGNPSEIITVIDDWTFSRDTRSSDPNWALVATQSDD